MNDRYGEAGFLTCPSCGAAYKKPHHFCPKCYHYAPDRWSPQKSTGSSKRWTGLLVGFALWVVFLGYLAWVSRSFIPNPLVLLRHPVSSVSASSRPGEWAIYGHDPGHSRFIPAGAQLKGKIRWSIHLGEPTNSAPAVTDGTLYVGGYFKLHALDAASGKRIWELQTSGPVHSTPAVAGDMLFLGLLDGTVMALDRKTGQTRWKFRTRNYVFCSPTVLDGVLYTGSGDGKIYALDAQTGGLIWTHRTGGSILYTPAVRDGILYASSADRMLYSISAKTGALRLRYRMYWAFLDSPVVANKLVYFTAEDGRLYTIRHGAREFPGEYKLKLAWLQFWLWRLPVPPPPRQTGSVWRSSPETTKLGFISAPAVTPDALYIGDQLGRLYARDAVKGTPLWEFEAADAVDVSPLVIGDRVYFGSRDGNLHALKTDGGAPVWKVFLGSPVRTSPVYASGLIFVKTEKGLIYAIE